VTTASVHSYTFTRALLTPEGETSVTSAHAHARFGQSRLGHTEQSAPHLILPKVERPGDENAILFNNPSSNLRITP
jgi:hypothetical protein